MTQTTQDKRGILLPNYDSTYNSLYPTGNKPSSTLLSRLDLTAGLPVGSGAGSWGFGAQSGASITVANDGTYNYLRGQYPIDVGGISGAGDNYIYGGYTPAVLQQELYVTVYARQANSYRHGCKFTKFLGKNTTGYANTTFGLDYTEIDNGSIQYIAYGDGTGTTNDTQNGMALYTPNYIGIGRAGTLPQTIQRSGVFSSASWGTGWHKFQIHIKQNSGTSSLNEVNDGLVELYVDGVMKARAINIFNRHWSNEFIESIGFFGYGRGATQAWEIHMRDITVSLNGWVD